MLLAIPGATAVTPANPASAEPVVSTDVSRTAATGLLPDGGVGATLNWVGDEATAMPGENDRQLVRDVRDRLDEWVAGARAEAFEAFFAGEDAVLTEAELGDLDRIDSEMSRQNRDGLWGTDQYGIVASGVIDDEAPPAVVCVYHPEVPEDFVYDGPGGIDDETEERLNDALWDYCERVADLVQSDLDEYVEAARE